MKELELYLHIPFCVRKCQYCDFLSRPSGAQERQAYVEDLCGTIRTHRETAKDYHITSIFVGGGTPSLLSEEQMEQIFGAVYEVFRVDPDAEITVEVNPGTASGEKFSCYRRLGINRLSIGLQSVHDRELLKLGRIHTYGEFLQTYAQAREKGFSNINLDLMSAIPLQTEESWEQTLRAAAKLGPEHISAYSLMIEKGTPFFERYGDGACSEELPDEDTERKMYARTKEILGEYGYRRYEISNYAKPGRECRHNLGYWEQKEYLGIGEGAASFMNHRRWTQGEEPELLSEKNQIEEYMFLGLRKMEGISKKGFRERFSVGMEKVYGEALQKFYREGLLEESGDLIRLTERGIDVSNYVFSEFLF